MWVYPAGIPSAHIGVSSREREEIHLSRLAKQRGGKKVGSGRGRGTGRGGGWGGSSSSRPTGCAFPDKSSQQPWDGAPRAAVVLGGVLAESRAQKLIRSPGVSAPNQSGPTLTLRVPD
eukprot:scaffold168362_cov15-Tisochrysis_lutea.AAC.1